MGFANKKIHAKGHKKWTQSVRIIKQRVLKCTLEKEERNNIAHTFK
jgi:hypothetical protein